MRRWFHADERFFSLMEEGPGASQRDHGDQAARRNTALFDRFSLATHRKRPTRVATPHNVRSFTCTTHQVKSTLGAHLPAGGKRETRDARNGLTNPSRQFVFFFQGIFSFVFLFGSTKKNQLKRPAKLKKTICSVFPLFLSFFVGSIFVGVKGRGETSSIEAASLFASLRLHFGFASSLRPASTKEIRKRKKKERQSLSSPISPPPSLLPKFEKKC